MVKNFIQQLDNHVYTISSLKFLFVSCNIWASSEVILKVLQATCGPPGQQFDMPVLSSPQSAEPFGARMKYQCT